MLYLNSLIVCPLDYVNVLFLLHVDESNDSILIQYSFCFSTVHFYPFIND